jgi:hypothetical protein
MKRQLHLYHNLRTYTANVTQPASGTTRDWHFGDGCLLGVAGAAAGIAATPCASPRHQCGH